MSIEHDTDFWCGGDRGDRFGEFIERRVAETRSFNGHEFIDMFYHVASPPRSQMTRCPDVSALEQACRVHPAVAVVFAFQFWSEGELGTILLTIVRPWGRFHHLIQFEAVGRYDWFDVPEWYLDEIRSQLGKTVRFPDWDAVAKLLLDTSLN